MGGSFIVGASQLDDWYKSNLSQTSFLLRICPARKGQKFVTRTRLHRVGEVTFHCHKEVVDNKWQGECVVCDFMNQRYKEAEKVTGDPFQSFGGLLPTKPRGYQGTDEDFKRDLNSIKPVERYYFNVIAREEEERGVLKWVCGKSIYAMILEGILGNPSNPNSPPLGDITNPQKGHDLLVKQTPVHTGCYSDYTGSQFMPASKLGNAKQVKKWVSQLHDLTTLRQLHSAEEMTAAIENVFGYLRATRPKQVYRNITDPFVPAW